MKKYLDVIEYSKHDNKYLHLLIYDEKMFLGYGITESSLEKKEYELLINDYQSPLYKTYSMRYPWFNYKGFISLDKKIDIHAGNRNICSDTSIVIGAQPSEAYQSPYVINSEKAMHGFYDNFYSLLTKGDISIIARVKSII